MNEDTTILNIFSRGFAPLFRIDGTILVAVCATAIALGVILILVKQVEHRYRPHISATPVSTPGLALAFFGGVFLALGARLPENQVTQGDLLPSMPILAFVCVAMGAWCAWANIHFSQLRTRHATDWQDSPERVVLDEGDS